MSFTPAHCRAARALLQWSQTDLAGAAKTAVKTVADFERGARTTLPRTLRDISEALEAAGVRFLGENEGGVGVQLKGDRASS